MDSTPVDDIAEGAEVRADAVDWLSRFVAGIPAGPFLARRHGELISTFSAPEGWAAPLPAVTAAAELQAGARQPASPARCRRRAH